MGMARIGWKWWLVIVFVALVFVGMVFMLSSWGFYTMKGWLADAYEACPAEERATHWSGDYWISLAWWEASIVGRVPEGKLMYQEFLAIAPKDGRGFIEGYNQGMRPWSGKWDSKTGKGWGILHERAPEVYYTYLETQAPDTKQAVHREAVMYYHLFYREYMQHAKTNKPHPKFYKYWKFVERKLDPRFGEIPRPMPRPADFEGPAE